jgi:hypothetical protein
MMEGGKKRKDLEVIKKARLRSLGLSVTRPPGHALIDSGSLALGLDRRPGHRPYGRKGVNEMKEDRDTGRTERE